MVFYCNVGSSLSILLLLNEEALFTTSLTLETKSSDSSKYTGASNMDILKCIFGLFYIFYLFKGELQSVLCMVKKYCTSDVFCL